MKVPCLYLVPIMTANCAMCVAMCFTELPCVTTCYTVSPHVTMCHHMLLCVTTCCYVSHVCCYVSHVCCYVSRVLLCVTCVLLCVSPCVVGGVDRGVLFGGSVSDDWSQGEGSGQYGLPLDQLPGTSQGLLPTQSYNAKTMTIKATYLAKLRFHVTTFCCFFLLGMRPIGFPFQNYLFKSCYFLLDN